MPPSGSIREAGAIPEVGSRDWLTVAWAEGLARSVLRDLPDRLAHSLAAARQARLVISTVPAADRDLLVMAAVLHDIGYAAPLVVTGFHPLDGANYLMRLGPPVRLAALVAHHSEARMLAAWHDCDDALSVYPREEGAVADALVYADMTAGPTGQPMKAGDRLVDICARHAVEDPDLLSRRLARTPLLLGAVTRVEESRRAAART